MDRFHFHRTYSDRVGLSRNHAWHSRQQDAAGSTSVQCFQTPAIPYFRADWIAATACSALEMGHEDLRLPSSRNVESPPAVHRWRVRLDFQQFAQRRTFGLAAEKVSVRFF
jgi:hypothetical protein